MERPTEPGGTFPAAPQPTRPRGRLAPSPTGNLHLGNAFAFLLAWLDIRSLGGTLILRMEDIDPDRSRAEYARGILRDLEWLGLSWDEGPDKGGPCGPYVQSERMAYYADLIRDLEPAGLAYSCFCTRKELRNLASAPHIGDEGIPYPGTCRNLSPLALEERRRHKKAASLRLNTDLALEQLVRKGAKPARCFNDAVLGEQPFTDAIRDRDFPLRRSDGVVSYQLAVAADDAAMGVTRVLRGEDLLSSTPRQLLLFELTGTTPPVYAHLPLVHDHLGERLAKRHKSLELRALRDAGVSSEAVTGCLAWMAGLLDAPRIASPGELAGLSPLAAVRGRRPQLPEDTVTLLKSLK